MECSGGSKGMWSHKEMRAWPFLNSIQILFSWCFDPPLLESVLVLVGYSSIKIICSLPYIELPLFLISEAKRFHWFCWNLKNMPIRKCSGELWFLSGIGLAEGEWDTQEHYTDWCRKKLYFLLSLLPLRYLEEQHELAGGGSSAGHLWV